jgi:hypothetical protein
MNNNVVAACVLKRAIAAAYHDRVDHGPRPRQSVESSTQQGKLFQPHGDENSDSTHAWIQNDVASTCRSAAQTRSGPNV